MRPTTMAGVAQTLVRRDGETSPDWSESSSDAGLDRHASVQLRQANGAILSPADEHRKRPPLPLRSFTASIVPGALSAAPADKKRCLSDTVKRT